METSIIDRYINETDAFDFSAGASKAFNEAMLESFRHHYSNSINYRKICDYRGIVPGEISDYRMIPRIFVQVFKRWKFISCPEEDVKISLSSSGTGGRKSFIYLDSLSLERIEKIVHSIFGGLGMKDPRGTNYICFTYDPEKAGDVGTAFSDKMLIGLTGINEVFYTMKWSTETEDFEMDINGTLEKFNEFASSEAPLRILGFPAHLYFALTEYYQKGGKQLSFPEGSAVITGGGWKNHSGREIPKPKFKKILGEMLGIEDRMIRDHFGMVEHGIPYVDCEYGNLHIPSFARVHTAAPLDGKLLESGETGLLHFFSPYCNSYPSISLLSTDFGRVRNDCPCGRGEWIELLGRAGTIKHKGCAIAALDKLRRQIDSNV